MHPLWGLNFYASQSKEKKSLPAVILFCEEAEELETGCGVREGDLYAYMLTQKDDETVAVHDERLVAVGSALSDIEPVKQALNYPGALQPRPVNDFHLYGFYENRAKKEDKERHFGEAIRYRVTWATFDRR